MQESYIPKNEEIIKQMELLKGRKITLIKKAELSVDRKSETIEGVLADNVKMDSPIVLENGKGIGAVKNVKREGKKIFIQTPDGVYELKIE
jgi:hypothetical protein